MYQSLMEQSEANLNTSAENESTASNVQTVIPAAAEEPATIEGLVMAEEPVDGSPLIVIEALVNWLDGLWQSGELTMTEEEYQQFRSDIQGSSDPNE